MIDQKSPCFFAPNAFKADFDAIYKANDPRSYFQVLGGLDYVIPEVASPVILQLAERLIELRGRPITILDIGCSYGVLAAVARHGASVEQLRARYSTRALQALSSESVAACDTHYFASWPPRADIRFIGLDRSAEAVAYACRVGLLDEGLALDLETGPLNQRAQSIISRADLIVSTGAVGYISERTFAKALTVFEQQQAPWIASFVLRMFDYDDIARTLLKHGLETERFSGATFVQRRFKDPGEFAHTLQLLDSMGLDPTGKEREGLLHAELFVSRPSDDIAKESLSEIIFMPCERQHFSEHERAPLHSTCLSPL